MYIICIHAYIKTKKNNHSTKTSYIFFYHIVKKHIPFQAKNPMSPFFQATIFPLRKIWGMAHHRFQDPASVAVERDLSQMGEFYEMTAESHGKWFGCLIFQETEVKIWIVIYIYTVHTICLKWTWQFCVCDFFVMVFFVWLFISGWWLVTSNVTRGDHKVTNWITWY